MPLIERVQNILMKPQETWVAIARENTDVEAIYRDYLVFLAAIPAVAGFLRLSLMGIHTAGIEIQVPLMSGLVQMAVSYLLTLGSMYVLALIVDALAPGFGGTKNAGNALKLVAYGSTAGLVGGVFELIPHLGLLGLVSSLYSVYLIYLGLPVLMKCPADKAGVYTAVVIVCAIVAMGVLSAVSAIFLPSGIWNFGGNV
jgi:hypothetical protein